MEEGEYLVQAMKRKGEGDGVCEGGGADDGEDGDGEGGCYSWPSCAPP